jgi:dTDP-glucose 4,6-dehydratase
LASDPAISLQPGDVRSFHFPQGVFRYVIHAATEASLKQATEAPLEMLSTIVAGTERALQFAAACRARKFLLTSSGGVYGKLPPNLLRVPETYAGAPDQLQPASLYGEGKRMAELLCCLYGSQGGLECKIARGWAFCGPYFPLDRHFAIGNFIRDAMNGKLIEIQGDGTPRRSYMYGADLALWLWTILLRAPSMMPINVGSPHDVSILELAQIVAATLNPKIEIRVASLPNPDVPPARYVPNVDRAYEVLGLRSNVDLESVILRTAAWHQTRIRASFDDGVETSKR